MTCLRWVVAAGGTYCIFCLSCHLSGYFAEGVKAPRGGVTSQDGRRTGIRTVLPLNSNSSLHGAVLSQCNSRDSPSLSWGPALTHSLLRELHSEVATPMASGPWAPSCPDRSMRSWRTSPGIPLCHMVSCIT